MLRCLPILLLCLLSQLLHAQPKAGKAAEMCIGDTAYLSITYLYADSVQWFLNDTAVAGANRDTLITQQDGVYYAKVFKGGCDDKSGIIYIHYSFPQLVDDDYSISILREYTMNVLQNDKPTCAPFDLSTLKIITPPKTGTIVSCANGRVIYRPSMFDLGTDQFTYVIRDEEGRLANIATVNIELDLSCALIYPNPTSGLTNIIINNNKFDSYAIYDANGRKLFERNIENIKSTLDLSGLAQGVYMVKFMGPEGPGCSVKVKKE